MLLLLVLFILVGVIIGYFILRGKLDGKRVWKIVFAMFLLTLFALLMLLGAHWFSSNVRHYSDTEGIIIMGLSSFALGIDVYLFFYLILRLRSFPKILGLGVVGLADIALMCFLGSYLLSVIDKGARSPFAKAMDLKIVGLMDNLDTRISGLEKVLFSRESLMAYYIDNPLKGFDNNYMVDIAPNLDLVCQLKAGEKLGDTLQTVIGDLKDELDREGFENIGWQEGTEIYVKAKENKYRQVFQFIDADTKTPVLRLSVGEFAAGSPTFAITGKRDVPPKPKSKPVSKPKQAVVPKSSATANDLPSEKTVAEAGQRTVLATLNYSYEFWDYGDGEDPDLFYTSDKPIKIIVYSDASYVIYVNGNIINYGRFVSSLVPENIHYGYFRNERKETIAFDKDDLFIESNEHTDAEKRDFATDKQSEIERNAIAVKTLKESLLKHFSAE
jgi:hypothetical protein